MFVRLGHPLVASQVLDASDFYKHKKRMKTYVDKLDELHEKLYLAIDYQRSPEIVDLVSRHGFYCELFDRCR